MVDSEDPPWLTEEEQATWRAYLMTNLHFMRELDRQLRQDSGLSHAAYGLLVRLNDRPGGSARITELAGALDHSQSRTSHAVARLERAGMVRREADADDGRVVHVAITDTGRAALVRAAPGHVRRVREVLFDGLGPGQLATLRAVLEGMLERLDPATDHDHVFGARPAAATSGRERG